MLIREVIAEFEGRVDLVSQDFGDSPLAEKFGIQEYPAVFVEDALVARPQDFHKWDETQEGRYIPWGDLENRARFQEDLRHFLKAGLQGEAIEGFRADQVASSSTFLTLPNLTLTSIQGETIPLTELRGKIVLVEFWASWCPPCMRSLDFLNEYARTHADEIVVLGLAVASPQEAVEKLMQEKNLQFPIVPAGDDLTARFGNVVAIPTMMVYDPQGRRAQVLYGAPPDLHKKIERAVESLRR